MIGYNTLYKSMNGIKVVSDGISFISEGVAQHEDIIYNNTIMSNDSKTILKNNNIKTETIECNSIDTDSLITANIEAENIQTKYFKVLDSLDKNIFLVDGLLNDMIYSYKQFNFNEKLYIIDKDIHQVQTGKIYQQGTGENQLKDTYVNGYLKVGSNITQTGGSSSLKDLTVEDITQIADKGITQSGNVSNNLAGTTNVKNLVISDSVIFPSNVEVPAVTTSDDIIMNGDAVINQDTTVITSKFNNFRDTRTLNLFTNGNISQTLGGATATLKNLIVEGISTLQGDITQTAGTTELKTLRCNNITLNENQIITMSGTGYITQSGTGTNTLKNINMLSGSNINQTNGIISQTGGGINVFSHYRTLGFGIIAGKNGAGTTHYYNAHNVFGLQFQYGRTSDNHCYIMSNRATGGNGAFRFQRYVGSIYLDEPLFIGDEITVNKNLSIPGGSLSCSSATIGIISQDELNTLENMNYNIKNKFQSLDEQINNLSVANNNNNLALTGISYNSSTDTTTIDNNLIVKTTNILTAFNDINFLLSGITYNSTNDTTTIDNNLIVKNTNILTSLNDINFKLSGISYNQTDDLTTINNHMLLPSGNNLKLGSMDVKYNIDELNTKTSGITYNSTNDTTTIDNNLTVNNVLTVQGLDVKTEIENIKATYTTGVINTDELITKTLTLKDINESALQQVNNNLTIINKDINGIIDIKNNTSSYININKNTITFDNTNKIVFKKNIESTGVNTFNGKCTFNEDITVPKSIIGHTITSNNFTNTGRITSGSIFNSSEINTSDINVSNNIFVENLINHKNAILLHTTKNIISDLSLTFPLAQINILTRNNPTFVNVNVSLPSITNTNFTGQTFEFITHSNNSSLTLTSSTGSKIYNNYGVELSNIVIQIDKIEYVKFVIRGTDYWIVETKQRDNTCGYILDGTLTGRSVLNPVICSCKYLNPENGADAVVVNPGYKFKCFVDFEYLGNVEVFDNSDGLTPQYFVLSAPNYTSSIKVFYKDVLIFFPNIS